MRPAPIPAEEVWDGARRVVIGPPGNDLDSVVEPVEVLADLSEIGPRLSARCILEDGDAEMLTAGGTVWVSFYGGQLLPFSVDVQPPVTADRSHLLVDVEFDADAPDWHARAVNIPDGMEPADFLEGCAQALVQMAEEWRTAEDSTGVDE